MLCLWGSKGNYSNIKIIIHSCIYMYIMLLHGEMPSSSVKCKMNTVRCFDDGLKSSKSCCNTKLIPLFIY